MAHINVYIGLKKRLLLHGIQTHKFKINKKKRKIMEITSFVLGMLAIVTVALVAVIVVGIVKILKLTKQVKDLETTFFAIRGDLYRNLDERVQPIWRQFEDTGRDITMIEKTIRNQIDQTNQELHRRIDQINQELDLKIGQNKQEVERTVDDIHRAMGELSHSDRRYIDSRIDKLIDTYFEHIGAKKPIRTNKEFING